ncbi:hypothetical protein [Symbioplanes lichenis]|uniref:hypothetical protein n=1 Tax=Symbioplanes lichenis TaxID=1629072 RepID=UPI00273A25BD|nr:hypothetical protein [Actinoplanes lichenis]
MVNARIDVPGNGRETVLRWVRVLHLGNGNDAVWRTLTHDLRLTVAQHYLMALGRTGDDAAAAWLATGDPADEGFRYMVDRQCAAWRAELVPLIHAAEIVGSAPVGADLESVVVASARVSRHSAREQATFTFMLQHGPQATAVAAVGNWLPLPGWPPERWTLPHT